MNKRGYGNMSEVLPSPLGFLRRVTSGCRSLAATYGPTAASCLAPRQLDPARQPEADTRLPDRLPWLEPNQISKLQTRSELDHKESL